jgi:cell division protein ZapA
MAHVTVSINGRQFRMACEDGQEDHLRLLAKELDDRILGLRGQFGEIGDSRLTVMAALMVSDELSETNRKLRRAENELSALQDARAVAADRAQAAQSALMAAFATATERIESMARKLSQPVAMPESKVAQG